MEGRSIEPPRAIERLRGLLSEDTRKARKPTGAQGSSLFSRLSLCQNGFAGCTRADIPLDALLAGFGASGRGAGIGLGSDRVLDPIAGGANLGIQGIATQGLQPG